ncbi:MAG: PAS domain-containing protein [Rhodospirillaceae bacterium]
MPYTERPVYTRPAVLIAAALAAISVAIAAPMAAGASATLMMLVIVVTAAAWYGGPRLGFLSTAVGSAITLVFQHADWQLPPTNFYLALLLYAVAGVLISRLYGGLQAAGARLDAQRALYTAELEHARRAEAIARQRYEAVDRALRFARMAYWECDPATGQIRREESSEAYGAEWVLPRVTTIDAARAMVHPDDAHRVEDQAREAWRSGRDLALQCRVRFPNGAVRWVEVRGTVASDEKGKPTMLYGLIADIEEQKAGEEALRASEERFRSLVDHAPVLIWGNDANGALFVNRACVNFTGRSADDLQREGWRPVLHQDDAEDYLAQYEHAFQKKALFEAQVRIRRADGEYRWFKSAAVPRYAGDVFLGYAGSSVDITEIRQYMSELARAEHTLRDADRRKDQFLAVLSHELRNPLTPIRNAVAVLGAGASQERDVQWARGIIERQVGQLARILDDLTDISRITQNKLELRLQPTDIKEVVGIAVDTVKPLIDARHHRLEVDLPPKPVYVQADVARLAQVLSNLLNNAAKYTDKGGHIRVRAFERAGQVVMSVKDNGMGISQRLLPRIFDMFTQGDDNPSRPRDGLGIGLGLARGLVAMHGGRLEAHSEGVGKGSEFVVTLPGAGHAVASAAATAQRPVARPGEHGGLRILVADDVRDSAEGLAVLLRIGGNDVRIATDGAEALNLAADFQPEVAVLDIGMPKLSGYEVARQIRQQPWGENAVLIALTGWGQQDDIRRALDVGFNYHMVKPVNIPQLQELLEQLAARKARGAHAA